ncbi:MAG: FHA domain-containing protein [Polyangiales bacterium]
MIICPKCGKENQDHYKFCLGCGNELPRESGPKGPMRPTPAAVNPGARAGGPFPAPVAGPPTPGPFGSPASSPAVVPVAAPAAAPIPAPAPAPVAAPAAPAVPASCPQCGSPNPRANRFCITCGFDNSTVAVAAPVAAPPVAAPPVIAAAPPVAAPPVAAPPVAAPPVAAPPAASPTAVTVATPPRPSAVERAKLVLIRPDGSEGASYTLVDGENPIGRDVGGLFSTDTYLSPRHATFSVSQSAISVRDEGSLNGVYVRVERQQPVEIRDGDIFRIGQEILRFEVLHPVATQPDGTERLGAELEGLVGKVSLVTGRDTVGNAFPVPVMGIYLGRERGDILFPDDGYVSGLHCQLTVTGNRVSLTDVGSSNGTYVRLRAPRSLRNGDFLLLGQQLFRLQTL